MNRAAAFTFAAALAVTSGAMSTSACGGVVDQGPDDPGGGGAMYGVARYDAGEPEDSGAPMPMYGAAYPPDAGPPDDDGGLVAAYGLPQPP